MKFKVLLFSALMAFFSLVSCDSLEEIEYLGIPKITISASEMAFAVEGGDQSLTVKANRPWKVETVADWVIVDPESGEAEGGESQVTVSVLENTGLDRVAELKFSLGMRSRSLIVSQAGLQGSPEDLVVYYNDYDREVATQTYGSGTSWPYLDQFAGWKNETGTGAGNVSYSFKGMSSRANSTSNSNYSDYSGSGNNNMFFGASAYLATRNIALNGSTDFTLTFGSEKYSKDNGSVFTNSEFHIFLSADDTKWVEFTDYTFAGGTTEGRWNVATANFSVPEGTETLSICMQVDVASSYRMDDFKLVRSEGGAVVDFSGAVEMDFGAAVPGAGENPGTDSDASAIYSNNFDKQISSKVNSKWPFLDQFDGWKNAAGTGAANVSYSHKSASARASSDNNNIWLPAAGAYLSIQNIALNGTSDLQLSFSTICGSPGSYKKTFNSTVFKVFLSADNNKWVELPVDVTANGNEFDSAVATFSVPANTASLSITFEKIADESDGYRVDDVNLTASTIAGASVDFSKGVEKNFGEGTPEDNPVTPPAGGGTESTIAQVLALGANATLASGTTVEGIVISNMDLNNLTSKKGLYIQDATAGLQFYLAENHTFAFGDKVKVDLSGAQIGEYNGAVQISGLALSKISKISSGNTVTPKTVSVADFLANKYEGQYIAIENVQVAASDLNKTFVMDGAHTSINVETASGKSFVIFSSKYATYGTANVPQGSGTIKGISSVSKGVMQILFAQSSDYAGLTGTRFDGQQGGEEGGDDDDVVPPVVSDASRADFETAVRTSSYVTSNTAGGWILTNCAVQEGGDKDANPVYKLIGKVAGTDTWAKAVCMNGKTAAVGTIESPEISGGCGTLTLDYANIFTESNGVNFKIDVIKGGSVVKTLTIDEDSVTKMTKYNYSADVNVSGTFKLKFTNLCPSNNASSNKDRVSIWNLCWTPCAD